MKKSNQTISLNGNVNNEEVTPEIQSALDHYNAEYEQWERSCQIQYQQPLRKEDAS
jgi:hypothetical protein